MTLHEGPGPTSDHKVETSAGQPASARVETRPAFVEALTGAAKDLVAKVITPGALGETTPNKTH